LEFVFLNITEGAVLPFDKGANMHTGRPGWIQTVSLPPPSLQDNSADADRLVRVLKTQLKTDDIHLFLGLSPGGIIREPYIPVVNRPGLIPAPELGVAANPQAQVLIFPNAGSYFGGDLVAGILFSGLHRRSDTALLVDVGTNAEVVLGNRDWLVGCAGAAGPALEGGASQIGMLAGPGVIDHIERVPDENRFRCHTIDASPPRGICGSGLIELAALLFAAGMIDSRGRFVPENFRDRITYLELNINQEFMTRFSAARFLPHTDLSRFPSVKVRRRG